MEASPGPPTWLGAELAGRQGLAVGKVARLRETTWGEHAIASRDQRDSLLRG